jgi:hypothetical protein
MISVPLMINAQGPIIIETFTVMTYLMAASVRMKKLRSDVDNEQDGRFGACMDC